MSYLHLVCHPLHWLWALEGGGGVGERSGTVRKKERETGGHAQFHRMLDSGCGSVNMITAYLL